MQKFLDFIAAAEGADYDTGFGGTKIGLDQHPNVTKYFRNKKGQTLPTTAAGRYQFLTSTYRNLSKKLGLTDFSPASQDLAAVELIREKGAIKDVLNGNFNQAIQKTNRTWASFPGSPHHQRQVSQKFVDNFFNNYKGRTSKMANGQPSAPRLVRTTSDNKAPAVLPSPVAMSTPEQTVNALRAALGMEGFSVPSLTNNVHIDSDIPIAPMAQSMTPTDILMQAFGSPNQSLPLPVEDPLFMAQLEEEADNIRNDAVSKFISGGMDSSPPTLAMPVPLQKEIDRILADMQA